MIAAFLLLGAIVWLCIAAAAGWLAYRETHKRWLQVAVSLFVLWLPFWDVIPGLYFYYKAIREVGGVRIYRTVKAEGYLDRSLTDCRNCWTALRDSPYEYIEVEITDAGAEAGSLTPDPGYYAFRLVEIGNPDCAAFEVLHNAGTLRRMYGLTDLCPSAIHAASAISRFEYQSSLGWDVLGQENSFPLIETSWQKLRDLTSGEVVAEASAVRLVTWLSNQLEIPLVQYSVLPSGRPIRISLAEIIDH